MGLIFSFYDSGRIMITSDRLRTLSSQGNDFNNLELNKRLRFYRDQMFNMNQSYQNCQTLCFQLRFILNFQTTEILLIFTLWHIENELSCRLELDWFIFVTLCRCRTSVICVNQSEMKLLRTGNRLVCNVRTWPSTEIDNTSKPVSIKWK